MAELTFESNISMEEIVDNFNDVDFFEEVSEGLKEAMAYESGQDTSDVVVRKRMLPDVNVVEIRKSLNLTQKSFADVLGVSVRTVEAWECGKSTPTPTAKKLMFLINEDNSVVAKLSPNFTFVNNKIV